MSKFYKESEEEVKMNNEKILSNNKYKKLVHDLQKLVVEGRSKAEAASQKFLVDTYWKLGQRIEGEQLTGVAGYGESIMNDLAQDLKTDVRTLQYAVAFFKVYGTNPRDRDISWSHFRLLIGVENKKERAYYETMIEKEGWTRDQLLAAIRGDLYLTHNGSQSKTAPKLKRPDEATYIYRAKVDKVIDGDTLLLQIDLGFQVWKEQRVRLAGLDAPAKDKKGGHEALDYVRTQMAKAQTVMVKTHRIDIYGRYLGHMFYSLEAHADRAEVFSKGRYLNQELLDRGLVKSFIAKT